MKNQNFSATLAHACLTLAIPLVLSSLAIAQTTPATTYTVIDLGSDANPMDVNNNGEVVGQIGAPSSGAQMGFYFNVAAGLTELPETRDVSAINNSGDYVGALQLGLGGFLSSDGKLVSFGSDYTSRGINEVGQVAGSQSKRNPYRATPRPTDPAFYNMLTRRWTSPDIASVYPRGTRQGVYADLYRLNDVNDLGIGVGVKSRYGLYGSSSILISVGDNAATFLPINGGGEAYAINNAGQVVGRTGVVGGVYSAYVYDMLTNTVTDLGVSSGGTYSIAYDINDAGQAVGSNSGIGFVWQDGQTVDLNTQLAAGSTAVITSANAINGFGDIAATGTINGVSHGLLLLTSNPNDVGGGGGGVENQPPTATIVNNRTSGRTRTRFLFDGRTSTDPDGTIVAYAWDFGDGETSDAAKIRRQYSSAGTYTATLTVTDDQGATDTATVVISVR